MPYKDLKGKRFYKLIVISDTGKRSNDGSVFWHCICDCGKECDIMGKSLISGNTKSCGCLNMVQHGKPRSDLVEGTALAALKSNAIFSTNTSGVRGVSFFKPRQKYHAYIGFKGKTYSLGYHDTIPAAAEARRAAEEKLYGGLLASYDKTASEE